MAKTPGRIERKRCCRCHRRPKASNRSYCNPCWRERKAEARAKARAAAAAAAGEVVGQMTLGDVIPKPRRKHRRTRPLAIAVDK